jgi:hypothetical protein
VNRIVVDIENRWCAHVSGYGARDLLTELKGRPPIWSSLSRAWVCTEETALDLVAFAERRGYEVCLTAAHDARRVVDTTPQTSASESSAREQPDREQGLW